MSQIKLKRVGIRGIGVPDTSSGYLCRGPGYDVYSRTSSEAKIFLRLELPQRNSFVVVPVVEGITIQPIGNDGRKFSLELSGSKVDEAIRQIAQAANSSQVVKVLEPFVAIISQLRIDTARDNSSEQPRHAAEPDRIVLGDMIIQDANRLTRLDAGSMRLGGRKYRIDGVEFQVTRGPAEMRAKVRVPRGHKIVVREQYRLRQEGEIFIAAWPEHFGKWIVSLRIAGTRLQAIFDEHVKTARTPREVWEATKSFRDFMVNNTRIVKAR